jgi:hypothetical protein
MYIIAYSNNEDAATANVSNMAYIGTFDDPIEAGDYATKKLKGKKWTLLYMTEKVR